MQEDIGSIVQELRTPVNQASNRETTPTDCLAAMWDIGEILRRHAIDHPHSFGVRIQKATGGIVKRPLIFRSAKVREIWPDKASLMQECSGLRSQHNVVEMFPYLDPVQRARYGVSESELSSLRAAMVRLSSREFSPLLMAFKRAHPQARLGRTLDRDQHLPGMAMFAERLRASQASLVEKLENGLLAERPTSTRALAERLRFAAGAAATLGPRVPTLDCDALREIDASLVQSGVLTNLQKRKRLWRLFSRGQIMELSELVLACSGVAEREDYLKNKRMASALTSGTIRPVD